MNLLPIWRYSWNNNCGAINTPSRESCRYVTKNKYDAKGKKHQLSLLPAFIYLFSLIYPINATATGCTPMVQFLARIIFFLFTNIIISFWAHLVCNPVATGNSFPNSKAGGIKRWPLTSMWYWHLECVALYLHAPHTMVCCLSTGGSFAFILFICKYI